MRAEMAGQSFTGTAVYAGADFLTLDADESLIDVAADRVIWVVERQTAGGREQSGEPMSLKARLSEISETETVVRLITTNGQARVGPITAVAVDHIEIGDQQGVVLIPLPLIGAVVRSKPLQ